MTAYTARDIAEKTGGRLSGSGEVTVTDVAGLDEARPGSVSFLGADKYREKVQPSQASVVLVPPDFTEPPPEGRAWIICPDPSNAFTTVIELFAPPPIRYPAGINETAVVHESAEIGADVHIGPHVVIEQKAVVKEHSVVGANTYIGADTCIGAHTLIYPNVTVRERTRIGDHVIIHSGAVIGSDGFGFIPGKNGHTKIPQVGIVQIDDDVEIGAQCAIDRARFGTTWIQRGVKIDNLVHIAHNVIVGQYSFIVAQVGISGSVRIGQGVSLAGQAGVSGHLEVGDGAVVMGQAGVTNNVSPGEKVVGMPAVPRRQFVKNQRNLEQVDVLKKKVQQLEKQVAALSPEDPDTTGHAASRPGS